MKNTLPLVAAALLVAGASLATRPAHATPSTLGFYPSTDIYGKGNVHFDADTYQSTNFKNGVSTTSGLTYGFGPDTNKIFGRTEAGFDYNFGSAGPIGFDKRIFGNFKTQLFNNDDSQTRVVFGGWGLGDSTFSPNYLYLLGSKNFPSFGRIHVGVARGLSDNYFGAGTDKTSLHLAYDRTITSKLSFCADYYSGKGPASGVQPTLYFYPNDKCDFGFGYFRGSSAVNPRSQFYICFDYNFDFKNSVQSTLAPPPTPENTETPATK